MNRQISNLYTISKKSNRLIIGLMSGTSLDGLDMALCRIHGSGVETTLELLNFETKTYTDDFRTEIREVFAKSHIDHQKLCGLHAYVGRVHAQFVQEALISWNICSQEVDLIASHGQTVFHAPQSWTNDNTLPNSTLQIGDGDHIAVHTGIITVSDFRQKHVAAGGEGAPLAAYGDYLLYNDDTENRILLNIGGIANLTFLPHRHSTASAFATDLGPGNTIMNQYVSHYLGKDMDENGTMAAKGHVNHDLLKNLFDEPFFLLDFPKTTGVELFNLDYFHAKMRGLHLRHDDILATLNAFSAQSIYQGIQQIATEGASTSVYCSGGGIHNTTLMNHIRNGLSKEINLRDITALGMNPDAKEACLFALLANETVAGNPENVRYIKDSPAICMGKISFPH
ncbi:anhydro-N-acetylmuramic acid kinase [Sphingobacterium sp. SGG-5]|nr:anhydro-N-acetylmuramic acid kinase [Sphingobacterium sp. SGG-5]